MKKFIKTIAVTLATVLVLGMTVSAASSKENPTVPNPMYDDPVSQQLGKDANIISKNGISGPSGKIGNLHAKWLIWAQEFANKNKLGVVKTVFFFDSNDKNCNFTCRYDGLKENQEYVFLHYTGSNAPSGNWDDVTEKIYDPDKWEIITAKVNSDLSLTGFFASFSPIAIAEGSASAASVVSPKTGEVVAIAAIMALIMIAGAVVCAKKVRLQK